MKGGTNPFNKLKVPFAITNAAQFTIIIGLVIALSTNGDSSTQIDLAKAGTIIIICFGLLLTTAFVAYGHLLAKVLGAAGKQSSVRRNIQAATIVFPLCFFLESITGIITVSDFDTFYQDMAVVVGLEYLASALSMLSLLWIFRNGVSAMSPNKSTLGTMDSQTERSSKASKSDKSRRETIASTKGAMGSSESNLLSNKNIELQSSGSNSKLNQAEIMKGSTDSSTTSVPANTA
jgi:hypothetical protein